MLSFYHWYDTEGYYDGGNVKISANGGASWEILDSLNPPYNDTASTGNAGIPGEPCYSGHGQGFWEEVTRELSGYIDSTITLRFHFGSDGSVQYSGWYIDDVTIYYVDYTAGVSIDEIPDVYSLTTRGITTGKEFNIRYSLPERASVNLRVFDCTGREIKQAREVKEAGYYDVRIEMDAKPAGIYFITMEANGKRFTRKTVLIR